MTTGMRRSWAVGLDLGEHLAPVLARQVEVEQDHVRARGVGVAPLTAQEGQRLHAVGDDAEVIADLALAQRLLGQAHITGVILHQQESRLAARAARSPSPTIHFPISRRAERGEWRAPMG